MADVQTMWSLAVVFFAIHLKLCGSHFSLDADAWLRFSALPGRESKTIAAQAVAESRSRVLIVAMRFVGVHATWAFALYLGYIFERENSVSSGIALAAVLFSYPMLVTVANEMVQLTAFWHMMIHHFMHFALAVVYIATAQQGGSEDWALDGIMVGSRFLVSAVSVRSRLAFPWQIVMSASLIALRPTPAWLMRELFLAVFTTFACAILEFLLLSRLEILLESVDTELMLNSCSRLLRGVCDGDILLDNQMQIHMPSQCLQRLLLSNSSYQGRDFEELLDARERPGFKEFLQKSTLEAQEGLDGLPRCLRASLRGANNIWVSVDLFHVPVLQAGETYHLLACREDTDLRASPDADLAPLSAAAAESSCGFSALEPPALVDLQELSLLLDSSTQFLDVKQAHLRFDCKDPAQEPRMPSLRALVRPTDWETIRSQTLKYKGLLQEEGAYKTFQNWHLRWPGDEGYAVAGQVTLLHSVSGLAESKRERHENSGPPRTCRSQRSQVTTLAAGHELNRSILHGSVA
ncbi:unnamed protein product [Effrenium voratum]|nr:unnamed protein product [Effrenium voratum]